MLTLVLAMLAADVTTTTQYKADLIDPRRPSSASWLFDVNPKVSKVTYPCGGVMAIKPWGAPPKGVHSYIVTCRNKKTYMVMQADATGRAKVFNAEPVKR